MRSEVGGSVTFLFDVVAANGLGVAARAEWVQGPTLLWSYACCFASFFFWNAVFIANLAQKWICWAEPFVSVLAREHEPPNGLKQGSCI
jgi:hypothetical protein